MTRREMLSTALAAVGAVSLGVPAAPRQLTTETDRYPESQTLHFRFGYSEPRFKTIGGRLFVPAPPPPGYHPKFVYWTEVLLNSEGD